MAHAPKGGCYVADHLAGQEKFYEGGQFLPESTPPLRKLAKKLSNKADKSSYLAFGDLVLRKTPILFFDEEGEHQSMEIGLEVLDKNEQPIMFKQLHFGDRTKQDEMILLAIETARLMDKNLKLI